MRVTPANPVDRSERNLWAWTILSAIASISLDAAIPTGVDTAIVYIVLVLLSLSSVRQSFTYFAGGVGTCLAALGLFISCPVDAETFWVQRPIGSLPSWPFGSRRFSVSCGSDTPPRNADLRSSISTP